MTKLISKKYDNIRKDLKFKRITYCLGFLFAAFFMIAIANTLSISAEHSTVSGSSISKSISPEVNSLQNINLLNSFIEVSPIFHRSSGIQIFSLVDKQNNRRLPKDYFLVLRT